MNYQEMDNKEIGDSNIAVTRGDGMGDTFIDC